MKAILLAAGEGKRLRPYTNEVPKCMVPFRGRSIIDRLLSTMRQCGIENIALVSGYKGEALEYHLKDQPVRFYRNDLFQSTNMVYSLFCADKEMEGSDIIISYSDILYAESVLRKLMESRAQVSVVVDLRWRELWEARMEDPLSDAETLKMDSTDNIIELGRRPKGYKDIEGQYIGLVKFSKGILPRIRRFYEGLDRSAMYDGQDFNNLYMTSFLQLMIDRLTPVKGVLIQGGWLEIDSTQDLERYMSSPDLNVFAGELP